VNTDEKVKLFRKISESFELIDFTQPYAHEVCRALTEDVGQFFVSLSKVADIECAVFSVGVAYAECNAKYQNILPVQPLRRTFTVSSSVQLKIPSAKALCDEVVKA
jgi:hypothetical protein